MWILFVFVVVLNCVSNIIRNVLIKGDFGIVEKVCNLVLNGIVYVFISLNFNLCLDMFCI